VVGGVVLRFVDSSGRLWICLGGGDGGMAGEVLVHRLGQDLPSSVACVVYEDLQDTVCPKRCRIPAIYSLGKRPAAEPFSKYIWTRSTSFRVWIGASLGSIRQTSLRLRSS
jgi:hypothetical protein